MDIQINPNSPSFGIYKYSGKKLYGDYTMGVYKGYKIEIYDSKRDNAKLYYVSDNVGKWIKSKLKYIHNGITKIIRSENKNKNGL